MQTTPVTIQHVHVPSSRSFEATIAAFEVQLGTYDPQAAAVPPTASTEELAQIRQRIAAMAGSGGFMQFGGTINHGGLRPLVGQPASNGNVYILGHPLIAIEMTRYNPGAGLYVPLRVMIFEDAQGVTCTEYDLPSSLLGQFDDERITKVGLELDQKLAALVKEAS